MTGSRLPRRCDVCSNTPASRHVLRSRSTACTLVLMVAASGAVMAQPPEPAAVGRERPLTSTWLCENERSVLLNAHPLRPAEEASLTYAGTRVSVQRVRRSSDPAYASADGKVTWIERGDEAMLSFESLLDRPVLCRRTEAVRR
jgi:membrane-bound inhibitor of C-type lysozyme